MQRLSGLDRIFFFLLDIFNDLKVASWLFDLQKVSKARKL